MKICKICGAPNQDDVAVCNVCHSQFDTAPAATPAPTAETPAFLAKKKKKPLALPIVIAIIAVISLVLTVFATVTLYLSLGEAIFLFVCCCIMQTALYMPYRRYQRENYLADTAAHTSVFTGNAVTSGEAPAAVEENVQTADEGEFVCALSALSAPVMTATYDDKATLADAAALLSAKAGGLETSSARSLLAALAARRMIVLAGKDSAEIGGAVAALTALLGAEIPTVSIARTCTEPLHLYREQGMGEVPSSFLAQVYGATGTPRALRAVLLQPESPENLGGAFSALTSYLATPTAVGAVTVQHADLRPADHITLPANVRLLMGYRPGRSELPSYELAAVGVLVDLKLAKQTESTDSCGAISLDRFLHLVEEAEQQHYIVEDTWKKIDELSELLAEKSGFAIENRTANAMERFAGVYMAAGGTENEALDAALSALVLPAALISKQLDAEGKEAVSAFMDTRFGLENLPLCTEALKKLGTV